MSTNSNTTPKKRTVRLGVAEQRNVILEAAVDLFSADGSKLFISGTQDDNINQYTLPAAFDLSGIPVLDGTFSVAFQADAPQALLRHKQKFHPGDVQFRSLVLLDSLVENAHPILKSQSDRQFQFLRFEEYISTQAYVNALYQMPCYVNHFD